MGNKQTYQNVDFSTVYLVHFLATDAKVQSVSEPEKVKHGVKATMYGNGPAEQQQRPDRGECVKWIVVKYMELTVMLSSHRPVL